jgi:hypothetical protein
MMNEDIVEWIEEPVEGGNAVDMEWLDDETLRLQKSTENGEFAEIFKFEYGAKIRERGEQSE